MMIIDISSCKLKCWKCEKNCYLKMMFVTLSAENFHKTIYNSMRYSFLEDISKGVNPKDAIESFNSLFMALVISRIEFLKTLLNQDL